ncbi:MAG: major capsid protein [Prevotella sp.]
MAKVDFNVSNYAKLFGGTQYDRKVLATIVNNEKLMGINEAWYLTQGSIDPTFTPSDAHGMATFTVQERALNATPMANLRAPLADTNTLDAEGIASYSATIPDFSTPKIVEKAMERKQKEDLFAQMGSDATIIKEQWVPKVIGLRQSMNFTMNWMTAKLMTTGKIVYDKGQGIFSPVHKALIPDENFTHAIGTAWTDPSAKIITQMQTIESEFRSKWGYDGGMQWQMTKNFFLNTFIKNTEVLEKVNEFRALNDLIAVTFTNINTDVFNNAWQNVRTAYGLSPIVLVEEKEYDKNKETGVMTAINGWEDKYVVLRPTGDAVRFMRKQILDETYASYLNNNVQRNFAPIANGLGTIMNTTVPSGMYNEWHTQILFSCVPALVEFTKHVIVDISATA